MGGGFFCFYFGPLGQKERRVTVKLLGVCHKRNKNRGGERPPISTRGGGSLCEQTYKALFMFSPPAVTLPPPEKRGRGPVFGGYCVL